MVSFMDKRLERKNKLFEFITEHQDKPLKIKDLIVLFEIPQPELQEFQSLIDELEGEGKIVVTLKGKILLPSKLNMVVGKVQTTKNRFAFVIPEDGSEDIFIHGGNVNDALNKDIVLCKIIESPNGKRREGEIVKVLKQGITKIVGTFQKNKSFGFVVPDDLKFGNDVFISKANSLDAVSGHKVVVELTKRSADNKNPEGKIVQILGHENDPGVDILSIVHALDIPTEFPEEVMAQVDSIPGEVDEKDYAGRDDVRDRLTVTIDGEDAKDLDDAISLEKLDNGNFRLGVYIADVTNYVTEGSPLDEEAIRRGTSVYLADRVIPMLPHKLSNGLCSLNANVDRLALCCDMEISPAGNVISHKIYEGVINVNKRMSYTVVNDVLVNPESEYLEDNKDYVAFFNDMKELAAILHDRRIERGSIEFDFPESKIVLDKMGKPIAIKRYERNIATNIIEEFMLITNETIAEEYFWLELPFAYRSHSEPDLEKIEKLKDFIQSFGLYLKGQNFHAKTLQELITKIKDTPEEMIISKFVLRSMKQARYTPTCDGHYGLAAKYYCHFTSPIRRYPDLQIHRIIKENLNGKMNEERVSYLDSIMTEITNMCSTNERRAEEAERETNKLKKVEFMMDKLGQEFDGIISGVTSWGIYVELENTIEGMVSIGDLKDDYYIFDEAKLRYVAENIDKEYVIGQKVRIKVRKADLQNRTLDFEFVEKPVF